MTESKESVTLLPHLLSEMTQRIFNDQLPSRYFED